MAILWEKSLIMKGVEGGFERVIVPSNLTKEIQYLTIINITDNSVCIYTVDYTIPTMGRNVICLGGYSCTTIPITPEIERQFNVIWTNPSASNPDKEKNVRLLFTDVNLGYNVSFAPSFAIGGNVLNTAVVADDVGLAKTGQLPAGLTAGGNLKTAIEEDNVGLAKTEQLPAVLTLSGNLKTALAEAIPAGTNEIGTVLSNSKNLTILASAARTVNGDTSASPVDVGKYREGNFFLDVTAVSGTTPTLDVQIKTKDPVSGKWFEVASFAQKNGVSQEMLKITGNLGSLIAAFWQIGGADNPSFTFSIGGVIK